MDQDTIRIISYGSGSFKERRDLFVSFLMSLQSDHFASFNIGASAASLQNWVQSQNCPNIHLPLCHVASCNRNRECFGSCVQENRQAIHVQWTINKDNAWRVLWSPSILVDSLKKQKGKTFSERRRSTYSEIESKSIQQLCFKVSLNWDI